MKTQVRLIVGFFAFLLIGLNSLQAQSYTQEDVLYLKNGSVIRGQIVVHVPGSHIRIEILGGSELLYDIDEIDLIKHEPSKYRRIKLKLRKEYVPISFRKRGIYNRFGLGFGFGENEWGPVINVSYQYSLGYHFNQYMNVGIGSGLEPYESGLIMPFWAELHGDLLQKVISPHYLLQVGYGYAAVRGWNIDRMDGGVYAHAAVGFKVNTRRRAEWIFTLGFKAQSTYQERREWWGFGGQGPVISRGIRRYQRIVFTTTFGF